MAQCVTVRRAQKDGTSSSYCLTMTQSVIFNIKVYWHHENFAHTSTYFFYIDCKNLDILLLRQIETEHDRETQELQNCWTELRKLVRMLYGRREGDLYEEDTNVPDDESAQDSVHR